jgi:hypothetical protein
MSKIREFLMGIVLAPLSGSGEGAPRAQSPERRRKNPFLTALWAGGLALTVIGWIMWGTSDPWDPNNSTGWALMMTGVVVLVVALAVSAVLWQRNSTDD